MDIDQNVIRDAQAQLDRAARLVSKLEHADTATLAGQRKAAAILSEALANIHAAEARLK